MQERMLMKQGLEKQAWDTEVPQTDVLLQKPMPIGRAEGAKEDPRSLGWGCLLEVRV